MADKFAAIEASRAARTGVPPSTAYEAPDDPRSKFADTAVQALRAVMSQLSPSPAWRATIADMASEALAAAKGVCPRDVWSEGWKLIYVEREQRERWKVSMREAANR